MIIDEAARRTLTRRPWLAALVGVPLCALFTCLALGSWRRYEASLAAPAVSAADALRGARGGHGGWVRLTDAHFDCGASAPHEEHRYARVRAPSLGPSDVLIAQTSGFDCPAEGEPLFGEVAAAPRSLLRSLTESTDLDLGGPSGEAFVVEAPSREDAFDLACGLGVLAALAACFSVFGYVVRYAEGRPLRGPRGLVPTDLLFEALRRPPLRLRRAMSATALVLGTAVAANGLLFAFCAWNAAHEVWAIFIDAPSRWARAQPVALRGEPAVVTTNTDGADLLASVDVRCQPVAVDGGASPPLVVVKYTTPLWVPEVSGPVELRADGGRYLTSVGAQLALPRALGAALVTALSGGLLVALGWCTRAHRRGLVRQRASLEAVLARPKLVYVRLLDERVARLLGFASGGRTYVYEAPSGARRAQALGWWRNAVFDASRQHVLVVVGEGDEHAEPVLVADDGYPFALNPTPGGPADPSEGD